MSRYHANRIALLSIALLCGLCAINLIYSPHTLIARLFDQQPPLHGVQTRFQLPELTFTDQFQQQVGWQHYSDKPMYIVTAFTACRLSCPTAMALYQQLYQRIGEQAYFALITVDRTRDTPQQLAAYLNGWNPAFIGLRTDSEQQLKQLLSALHQAATPIAGSDQISHSANIYLRYPGREGLLVYPHPNLETISADFVALTQRG